MPVAVSINPRTEDMELEKSLAAIAYEDVRIIELPADWRIRINRMEIKNQVPDLIKSVNENNNVPSDCNIIPDPKIAFIPYLVILNKND
uniref:DUF2088 domain-containing protein n=1 Tax=Parastrongyloides trichosuri TaxID=131310 RepID=A0A0N4Z7M2_PARTI